MYRYNKKYMEQFDFSDDYYDAIGYTFTIGLMFIALMMLTFSPIVVSVVGTGQPVVTQCQGITK